MRLPDHGFGPLGQFGHGVLSGYQKAPPAPELSFGYNTMPDPPYPMVGHIGFASLDGASAETLHAYLDLAAESLRAQPIVPGASYSREHHRLQRLLRVDALALVTQARLLQPTESVRAWALAADVLGGHADLTEIEETSQEAVILWAVDRAGSSILMWLDETGTIHCADDPPPDSDPVNSRLTAILDAQYTWIREVFQLDKPDLDLPTMPPDLIRKLMR